jgi:hypothetical protein
MIVRTLLRSVLVLLFLSPVAGPAQGIRQDPPRKDRHALLIGVTYYENLPKAKHLAGPANDVLLVRNLLLDKFQFSPDQIVVLTEQAGTQRGKNLYPTRANIEREFKRLALIARPGDQVVIHMGGHGSQQPEDKNSPDPEPDGLDEIFLPRDVGAWNQSKGTVANAIIDDEMGAWLKAIRDKKSSVWITFDSCHSGTMIRGGDDREKARDLDPVDDLGIPRQAIKDAVTFAAKRNASNPVSRGDDMPPAFKLAKEGGIVAIYACQPNELTYEREFPAQSSDAKVYGLLTYSLCKILTEATEKSKEPLTYNELARRIHGQYGQWGRMGPTPLIEGVDRDRQVLGDKVWPGRSSIVLQPDKDGFKINAGALHGLSEGSILAVTPPPGQGDKLLGHVRIKELRTHYAEVEPCAYDKMPLVRGLPRDGVCKAAFIDIGDQQLRVAVDPRDAEAKAVSAAMRGDVEKIVKGLSGPQSLVRLVDKTNEADWLVRLQGDKVVLVPGSGWSVGRAPLGDTAFGPAPIDANLKAWLNDALNRIARAESLKRLAAGGEPGGPDQPIRLDLKVKRRKNTQDKVGAIPIAWPAPDVLAYDGDLMVFKLTNQGRFPIDVTLLYIDSGFRIDCLYPNEGELNRLRPGDSESIGLRINSKTTGLEQLVVIAVKATGQPVDFSQLAEPTLESALKKAGTRGDELKQSLDTPLGKLLKRGMYGQGTARGNSDQESADYSMFTVSLNVRPQKRPASNGN